MKNLKILMAAGALALLLAGCGGGNEMTAEEIKEHKGSFSEGASVHDPSIYEENGTYYIFGSRRPSGLRKTR